MIRLKKDTTTASAAVVSLFSLILAIVFLIGPSSSQTIAQSELDSVQWLISQYGLGFLVANQTICNQYSTFTCTTGGAGKTISTIDENDSTLLQVPIMPTNFTKLSKISMSNDKYEWNANNFFNGSIVQELKLGSYGSKLTSVSVNETLYLPLLKKLTIFSNNVNNKQLVFTPSSFPKLGDLECSSEGNSSWTYSVNCTTLYRAYLSALESSHMHFSIQDPSNMSSITFDGNITWSPSDLGLYYNLLNLEITASKKLNTYPFSKWPPKLESFTIESLIDISIPLIPLPSTLKFFKMSSSSLQGTIPTQVFSNLPANSHIDLSSNPDLSGTIPDSWCKYHLFILDTAVIGPLPDCFYCSINDTLAITTDLVAPSNFVCDFQIYNKTIIVLFGEGRIYGKNMGWAYSMDLNSIIPNEIFSYLYFKNIGPIEENRTIMFPREQIDGFRIVPAGIRVLDDSEKLATQEPGNIYHHRFYLENGTKECTLFMNTTDPQELSVVTIDCYNLTTGTYDLETTNGYYSIVTSISITQGASSVNIKFDTNSTIEIFGTFNSLADNNSVWINGTGCTINSLSETNIICQLDSMPHFGYQPITVIQDGFSYTITIYNTIDFKTNQQECLIQTYNCFGNGYCPLIANSTCICNTLNFYQNCSKNYPKSISTTFTKDILEIKFYGDFGPYGEANPQVYLEQPQNNNNNITCNVVSINQTLLICTLDKMPFPGFPTVYIIIDNLVFKSNTQLKIDGSSSTSSSDESSQSSSGETPQSKCQQQHYCYGHGTCNDKGKCDCDTGYFPIDNCRTKFSNSTTSNSTIIPDENYPNTIISIDGIIFYFNLVSIQEIDFNDNVLRQVNPTNQSWNVVLDTDPLTNTTTVNYHLNITTDIIYESNSTSNLINTTTKDIGAYSLTNITSTISFSPLERIVDFGDNAITIYPNSIKMSLGIESWPFSSNLATLRVLFSVLINDQQSQTLDSCNTDQTLDIPTFTNTNDNSSIEYLRVVKDNIQFFGRFLDYIVSDNGRKSYSQTKLLSLEPLNNNNTDNTDQLQSIAIIGISLPQCQSCLLDPDFTPLLIDKATECTEPSKTWRIVVGVVVVGVGLVAVGVGSVMLFKKIQYSKLQQKKMQSKLRQFTNNNN
ncbi:hypothetical protein DFA_10854 [Cavenderia fasciculata]|uniref:EGF-like domain-containing protein n=1 Tax=Cavenderia fasciculata TaxID=261658 RepID=F4QBK8_CACFS|nr:uncharacterized protein DFA_10854 [Cavenderia fasciculata]EGG14596.1 hypothetical protein DFA_10854 [Cavenderia fasciculata]|eukprot:XP_004351104.1 hypothetical protein DFA_10854 [Cavenderia fasciculata]